MRHERVYLHHQANVLFNGDLLRYRSVRVGAYLKRLARILRISVIFLSSSRHISLSYLNIKHGCSLLHLSTRPTTCYGRYVLHFCLVFGCSGFDSWSRSWLI